MRFDTNNCTPGRNGPSEMEINNGEKSDPSSIDLNNVFIISAVNMNFLIFNWTEQLYFYLTCVFHSILKLLLNKIMSRRNYNLLEYHKFKLIKQIMSGTTCPEVDSCFSKNKTLYDILIFICLKRDRSCLKVKNRVLRIICLVLLNVL